MERQAFLTFFRAIFFSSTLLKFSIAADTLSSSKSLRDGETLVSPGQKFELGFFSPGSSKNRYLGIWYVRTPDTVVWVANRNNPIIDVQGVLAISSDGGLILRNGTQSIIWSSNSTRMSAEEITPIAQLLDSGNLVLIERTKTDSVLWQSFDSMCDTRLPGMKLGANTNTGLDQHMTSWKAADDPSPGDFTYRIENNGLPQLVITMGSTKKYRSGPWNGLRFSGSQVSNNPAFKPVMEFNNTELISLYEPFNSVFDLATISAATRNFSHENMVGEGGFGLVYKGKLSTGQEIAVKRLSKSSGQGLEEFKNEVASIAKLQHRNLVTLLGCSKSNSNLILQSN